jgi:hypothetical protein
MAHTATRAFKTADFLCSYYVMVAKLNTHSMNSIILVNQLFTPFFLYAVATRRRDG